MNKMINALFNIHYLEELARREEWINKINPLIKLIVTLVYIICVAAIGKYQVSTVLLYGLYPILIISLTGLPPKALGQKMLVPAIAGASLGILNPFLDSNRIALGTELVISAGWLSLLTLFMKSMFSIMAALILVSTTKVEDIAATLNLLKVPRIMTIQFVLMFRYITILINEVDITITAYSLRSGGKTSIAYKEWGPLVGQLFIRTSKRSIDIYDAMKLRGFKGDFIYYDISAVKFTDITYLVFWITTFVLPIAIKVWGVK